MIDENQLADEARKAFEKFSIEVDKTGVYSEEDFTEPLNATQLQIGKENSRGLYERVVRNCLAGERVKTLCSLYIENFPQGQYVEEMQEKLGIARSGCEGGIEVLLDSIDDWIDMAYKDKRF